jgi:hypothetical protein
MQHGSAGLHAAAFESSGNLSSIGQLQSHALSHNERAKKKALQAPLLVDSSASASGIKLENPDPLRLCRMDPISTRLFCVTLAEFIDATAGIHHLLFAGVERMTIGTNFDLQVGAKSGARRKRIAATTGHGNRFIFRVYISLHCYRRWKRPSKNGRAV